MNSWFYYKSYSHWGQFKVYIKLDIKGMIFDPIDQAWYPEQE